MAGLKRIPKGFDGSEPTARPIRGLLGRALESIGQRAANSPTQVMESWAEIVGPNYAPFSQAMTLKDGILTVKVRHSAALAQLEQYEKPRLLKALQARFPEHQIQTLLFRMN